MQTLAAPALAALLLAAAGPAPAQEAPPPRLRDQILDGLRGSFALPWNELMQKEDDSEWRNLLTGFSGSLAFSYPLKPVAAMPANGVRAEGARESHLET